MYNSPHHPDFVRDYTRLIEMAETKGVGVELTKFAGRETWHVMLEGYEERMFHAVMPLSSALEAAIEHLAGIAVCK